MPPYLRRVCGLVALGGLVAVPACSSDSGGGGTDTGVADTTVDTGGDGGGPDAGADIIDEPPPREDLYVAYTRETLVPRPGDADYVQLLIATDECRAQAADLCSAGTCEVTEVMPRTPSEPLCNNGCILTPSMDWIVFFDPDEGRTLRKAPLGDDFQLSADSSIISPDVNHLSVGDGVVAYRTGNVLRVHRLETGDEVTLADPIAATGFYVAPDGSSVFLNRVTSLQSMSVSQVDPVSGNETVLYEFQDGGPRDAAGSLLRGNEPLALSPDGTRLAVLTTFRTQSNSCTSNADCTEPGFQCPSGTAGGRCFQHQQALHIINLDAAQFLDDECTSDSACGADHFCDLSAPDSDGNGRCMPGRVVVGPTGQNVCARISAGEYDQSGPVLSWRSSRAVVALLENSCLGEGTGIDVTDIVSIDVDSGIITPITQNPGLPHGGCYDDTEQCYEVEDCTVGIDQIAVSPGGSRIYFVADAYASRETTELWTIDALGDDGKEVLTRSINHDVITVSVHAR